MGITSEAIVTGLFRYPVKGLRAVAVDAAEVTPTGLRGDREFAIVGDEGTPLDQVKWPKLARIGVDPVGDDQLVFTHPDRAPFTHRPALEGAALEVGVTLDRVTTVDQGDEAAEWFSGVLGTSARLVRVGDPWVRSVPLEQFALVDGRPADRFTSVAPLLVNNQASLDDLNTRLDVPVPMNRFRMNVVVSGLPAYAEDTISTLRGQAVVLDHVTACERCAIITTDQHTGQRPSKDVIRVLNDYRKKATDRYTNGLLFGSYMAVSTGGTLRVGERLEVHQSDPPAEPLVLAPRGLDAPD
ncbi:MAG: MOSC domain-containing protein [Acidimicrobiales bacterium]